MKKNTMLIAKIIKTKLPLALVFAVAHLDLDAQTAGNPDSSFGTNGKVITPIWNDQGAHSVALQADGKIVVGASQYGNGGGMVIRYNSDGSVDSSFGTTGVVYLYGDVAHVVIQSDGKICAATTWYSGIDRDYRVTRLNIDGSLDSAYGNAGSVTTDIHNENNDVTSIAIQPDDKILVTGPSFISTALVRYNTDGSLDTTFGTGGIVYTTLSTTYWSSINFLAVQADGKIVGAGYYSDSTNFNSTDIAILRFNADGTSDTTFGNGGKVFIQLSNYLNFAEAIAIQTDGKIVVAAQIYNAQNYTDFGLVRCNPNGSLDSTFGIGGKVLTVVTNVDDYAYSMVIQPDGKIIVGGTSNISLSDSARFTLICYNTDGSLDSTFGTSGIVTTSFGSIYDWAYAVALQADGKIVLAGETNPVQFNDIAIARYISTTNVGIIDDEFPCVQELVYPNPIAGGTLTVAYELLREETITITLWDITGRQIITFMQSEKRASGKQKEVLTISQNLAGGTYVLQIRTHVNTTSVKVVKK